jgi:DNA-binding NtrC family response regulator
MEPKTEIRAIAGPLAGARILVVEDDFFIGIELESILTEAGGEVVELCRTVTDALAAAESDDLSVAVLDFRVGEETTTAVARRLDGRHVPFAFYTGQAESEPLLAEWPCCKVLSKQARAQALVSAVAELWGAPKVQPRGAGARS